MAVIVIRDETTATARWTSPFIVRAFFNDTITVAVWTGFHVRLMDMLPHPTNGRAVMDIRWRFAALPPKADMCSARRHFSMRAMADRCGVAQ
jgi:hypothetical protein